MIGRPVESMGAAAERRSLTFFTKNGVLAKAKRAVSTVLTGAVFGVAFAAVFAATSGEAWAQTASNGSEVRIQRGAGVHAGEFIVPINKSQILRLDVPFNNISIGNPKIADVLALTDRTMYILGKGIGSTSLTIFGPNRRLIAVADLVVTYDIEGIKARLHDLMPSEKFEVRAVGNAVVLGGYASSGGSAQRAVQIASQFAPGKVTNMIRVAAAQQVMLQVRFAEVRRSALKQLGINLAVIRKSGVAFGTPGSSGLDIGTGLGQLGTTFTASSAFFRGVLGLTIGEFTIQALFDALENKGFSRTLAEPTLIALSGDTADFLAGGEFPIITRDEDGADKVTFKEFGVQLAFTPTVVDRNRINLIVKPEVSKLDFDLEIGAGLENPVPALSTRRASTTVELGDGQSFAIAGLIQNDFDDNVNQVPWLGSVPVLGSLFRSGDFLRQETELVMVVTPYIVKPVRADQITLPTEKFLPPSEKDFFLLGKINQDAVNVTPSAGPGGRISGGVAGAHGHIVE